MGNPAAQFRLLAFTEKDMVIYIKAKTPHGLYVSNQNEVTEEQYNQVQKQIEQICEMDHLRLDTKDGIVYIPKDVIRQSIVTICVAVSLR